jgi:calcineurin-like phosphoesterase family protein
MEKRKPDFIIQLGDFSLPRKQNQPFIDKWNSFNGPKYHVLGNHDMKDFGFKKEETMKWWKMKKRYYSFDYNNFHFVVLDGNDNNPKPWNGYVRYIGQEQKIWLKKDLKKTLKPTILFSHQSLEARGGISNREEIRNILEKYTNKSGYPKVVACLSGHHHKDYAKSINKIPYVQINSMSYKWVGEKFQYKRFSQQIEEAFPNISKTCPYKEPLYTVITLDTEQEMLHIEGKKTSFIAPTPSDLKIPNAEKMNPIISERNLKI